MGNYRYVPFLRIFVPLRVGSVPARTGRYLAATQGAVPYIPYGTLGTPIPIFRHRSESYGRYLFRHCAKFLDSETKRTLGSGSGAAI